MRLRMSLAVLLKLMVIAQAHAYGDARRTSWIELKQNEVVLQMHDYSCGAAAVATLLTYHYGNPTTEMDILNQLPKTVLGYSILELRQALKALGFESIAITISFDELTKLAPPFLLYLPQKGTRRALGHFVVLTHSNSEGVAVKDPAFGRTHYSRSRFIKKWKIDDFSDRGAVILVDGPIGDTKKSPNRITTKAFRLSVLNHI